MFGFDTCTATVLRPIFDGTDRLGDALRVGTSEETVAGVLVTPVAFSDLEEARQNGTESHLTVHFPKGYTSSLAGCDVELTGRYEGTYRVVGDPLPFMERNTPTKWNYPAEVVRVDG